MLAIKRKEGESIIIGDDIEIKIVSINEKSVRIAIDAPKELSILRKELLEEIIIENNEASKINVELLKSLK